MACSERPDGRKRPVKTPRPNVAAIPHNNVADAMYRYPRQAEFLLAKDLVELCGIKADEDLFPDNDGGCGMTAVAMKFLDG